MRMVIGLTGLAGSGKSTAAARLIERHGFVRGKFAGALKAMMWTLLAYRGVNANAIERMIEGDLKEVPVVELGGRTPRHAMQTLGTEWGRDCLDRNLWVDTEMAARAQVGRLVFDDVRFPNEAEAIVAAGGLLVRIDRPGAGAGAAGHPSELIDAIRADCTIDNSGPIGALDLAVDALVRDMGWARAGIIGPSIDEISAARLADVAGQLREATSRAG